ncbi:FecR domain-containing protein [Haloferula chungangensis]|uniref:FecR domain-containing protein n=1 Tax=Haloferula chungangensis TaxID=1048331 RepID=A0ABW2L6T6_9BACT
MNSDDHRDRLVDMLLRELVGRETPPDVLEKVLEAVRNEPGKARSVHRPAPVSLPSARPSLTPIFAIAAVLTLAAVCLGVMHFQKIADRRTPTLSATTGSVNLSPGKLHGGSRIKTGSDSTATLDYPDGTQVIIEPLSSVSLPELSLSDQSKVLDVTSGGLQADVAAQGSRYPMTLNSEHAQAIVVGTRLSFSTSATRTRLEVTEGEVRFAPKNEPRTISVGTGEYAEADPSRPSISGPMIPKPPGTITGFTLMNADTDEPISDELIHSGQIISLSSLPTKRISLRAELAGETPFNVRFAAIRLDGKDVGIAKFVPQHYPPFFLAGDHSESQRPADCRPWIPQPGTYRISAIPTFGRGNAQRSGESVSIDLTFSD